MKQTGQVRDIAHEVKAKTGFILEHDVATKLEKQGWNIIHNRYYLDDMQATQREIDLLVYKVDDVGGILVYTCLIISCKKSENKDWIFLTRDTIGTKSNLDTSPFTYWSNCDEVNYQLIDKKFIDNPYCEEDSLKHLNNVFDYNRTVFAFREYDNSNKKHPLLNDTGIFDSIITLIKSQGYELESLPLRKKDVQCYYNINLLTVADVKSFIEVKCNGDILAESEIDRINYVNRFLVNRREHNSRIVFTKYSNLGIVISDFDLLHKANIEIITKCIDVFYSSTIKSDYKALNVLLKKYSSRLLRSLKWAIYKEYPNWDESEVEFEFSNSGKYWEIGLSGSDEFLSFLNLDNSAIKVTQEWLKKYLRSEDKFKYVEPSLPF